MLATPTSSGATGTPNFSFASSAASSPHLSANSITPPAAGVCATSGLAVSLPSPSLRAAPTLTLTCTPPPSHSRTSPSLTATGLPTTSASPSTHPAALPVRGNSGAGNGPAAVGGASVAGSDTVVGGGTTAAKSMASGPSTAAAICARPHRQFRPRQSPAVSILSQLSVSAAPAATQQRRRRGSTATAAPRWRRVML